MNKVRIIAGQYAPSIGRDIGGLADGRRIVVIGGCLHAYVRPVDCEPMDETRPGWDGTTIASPERGTQAAD